MAITLGSGWGFSSVLQVVTQVIGGVESVLPNIGIGRQIIAGGSPIQVTKIAFRVDLAPDVAPGTVISPTAWRLVAFAGLMPTQITDYQAQGFPLAGILPAIPNAISSAASNIVLWDEWLDFGAGDAGLNELVSRDFNGSGPSVGDGQTLSVVLCPITAALSQAHVGVARAMMTLSVFGRGVHSDAASNNGNNLSGDERSLQRYAVPTLAYR